MAGSLIRRRPGRSLVLAAALAPALALTCTRPPSPAGPASAATHAAADPADPANPANPADRGHPAATSRTSAPGHHEVAAADLPPPYATRSVTNPPDVVPRPEGASLTVPPGFHIAPYAEGDFERPRWLAVAPNGDVFVSDADAGRIVVLRGIDAAGRVRERFPFASGLMQPFGMAFSPGFLYVGDTNAVVRFAYQPGDVRARGAPETIAPLPGSGYREHWTRNLLFSKDFAKLYVTVGSATNDDAEADPERASILEMNPDGSGRRTFARGTRNPIGLAFRPGTSELWAVVQERDGLGDDLVPDYLTRVVDGAFYGWPFAYIGPHRDPRHPDEHPELVTATRTPDLLFQAHVALMDLVFYEGTMFPPDFRGDVIVSAHGSWNRSRRVGYGLARVPMREGRPAGGYDDFVTGWMLDPDRTEVWGRPVGLAVLPDGSLLVADDGGNLVWRVTYAPP